MVPVNPLFGLRTAPSGMSRGDRVILGTTVALLAYIVIVAFFVGGPDGEGQTQSTPLAHIAHDDCSISTEAWEAINAHPTSPVHGPLIAARDE